MLMKPTPWAFTPALVAPEWLWFWRDAKAVMTLGEGGGRPRVLVLNKLATIVGTPLWVTTPNGIGFETDGTDDGWQLTANNSEILGTTRQTIAIIATKTDSTNRDSSGFGVVTNNPGRMHAHWPFSDGNYYFDYNNNTTGRLTINSPPDRLNRRVSVFRAGSRGMAIWENGIELGSNATPITRGGSSDPLYVGRGRSPADLAKFEFIAYCDAEWTDAQVLQWTRDPFGPFRMRDDISLFIQVGDINTAEKRRSVSGIPLPLIPGVTPNVAKDQEWRAESGWSYSAIAPTSPPAVGNRLLLINPPGLDGGLAS